jgi:hypothetical protein
MSLRLLAPPGTTGQPAQLDVNTGGKPGELRPLSAVGAWPGAVSVSWAHVRPNDWTLVLEAIQSLEAAEFDYDGQPSQVKKLNDGCVLTSLVLPNLGVTLLTLHGLDETIVLVVAGHLRRLPSTVRLIPVRSVPD